MPFAGRAELDAGGAGDISLFQQGIGHLRACLLYTSDAADERSSVDLGGRRIIKKKTSEALTANRRVIIQKTLVTTRSNMVCTT